MKKKTHAEIIRKSVAGEPLSEAEKLEAFNLPFAERSLMSMRNYARSK